MQCVQVLSFMIRDFGGLRCLGLGWAKQVNSKRCLQPRRCVCVVFQEALVACQTRVSKVELQQQQQQTVQQLDNMNTKVLLGKCISVMLAIVTVILVCVSTVAKFTAPLLRSRGHLALTCVGASLVALLWKNWEHLQSALERLLVPH